MVQGVRGGTNSVWRTVRTAALDCRIGLPHWTWTLRSYK
jgi:hypothetical protein